MRYPEDRIWTPTVPKYNSFTQGTCVGSERSSSDVRDRGGSQILVVTPKTLQEE